MSDEWDRSQGHDGTRRTGFSFKSTRNTLSTKQIEELQARLEAAESDLQLKIDCAAHHRYELQRTIRPGYVAQFLELISESDSATVLQLQKYGNTSISTTRN